MFFINIITIIPLKQMTNRVFLLIILLSFFPPYNIRLNATSLNETAFEILKNSPGYKSDLYSLESIAKNLATESNLPDPELEGEYLVMPSDVDNRWAVELTWGLEWPGVYGARGKLAKSRMEAAEKQLSAQQAETLAEIKDFLLDFIRTKKKLLLLEELSQNNDTIYRLAEQANRGGEMTVLDLNKVRLEYANIRVAKATLLDEQAEIITSLNKIYGKDTYALLEKMDCQFPELVMPSFDEIELIKKNAPSVQAARADAQSALLNNKVAKMEALPSISFGYKHAFEDAMHFNGAVLGVSIPIFSSRGKQKAAKAEILAAEYKAESTALEIESEVNSTLKRLDIINQQINEIAPIIENANYNQTLLKAYKGGEITLLDYISDRNYFTTAAIELVTLRHNAAKAIAFLHRYLP